MLTNVVLNHGSIDVRAQRLLRPQRAEAAIPIELDGRNLSAN